MKKPEGMRIKSFFARSVDQAITQARVELGPEAILLNTRKLAQGAEHSGGYEVVFGFTEPSARGCRAARSRPDEPERRPPQPDLAGELNRLHSQMDEIRNLIMRSARRHPGFGQGVPELSAVYSSLMSSEVDAALSSDIVDRLEASMATDTFFQLGGRGGETGAKRWKTQRAAPGRLEAFVRAELQRRVGVDPRLGVGGDQGTVVVLVGPPGAGKTTSMAKLASTAAGLAGKRPIRLLSLDASRAAALLQLQSVAKASGASFDMVPAVNMLPGLVAEARKNGTVFIDTPGYCSADAKAANAVADTLSECPGMDVHLVVPGYMKARDLRYCIESYGIFRPLKLLVTKMDETRTFGSVFSEAARGGLRLSFLAHGPVIPNDIRPASPEDLLSLALERQQARAQCVA
jgi:flagellar biosynthesis protein FlhF